MKERNFTITAVSKTFASIKSEGQQIEVVEWMWSGTERNGVLRVHQVYLLGMVGGALSYIEELPVKEVFEGPSNKFKGFVYSQIMKLGVPFRNLFKNLSLDVLDLETSDTSNGVHDEN